MNTRQKEENFTYKCDMNHKVKKRNSSKSTQKNETNF